MVRVAALLAVLVLALGGCVEAEETLTIEVDGTGTYALRLTWDAGLVRRLVDLVGARAVTRLEPRPLPLDAHAWRESLEGRPGLALEKLAVVEGEAGQRTLELALTYERIEDLVAWEPFGRRSLSLGREPPRPAEGEGGEGGEVEETVRLAMDPLARVPYLDPLAAALGCLETASRPAEGGASLLDPPPLERLELTPTRARLAAAILAPHLERVRLALRVRAPRRLISATPRAERSGRVAAFAFTFEDLRSGRDRRLRLSWRPGPADAVPEVRHEGERPVRRAGTGGAPTPSTPPR